MDDKYIRQQDAVDELKAQADTMRTWVSRYDEQRTGILTAVNIVEDIEPADVAPVVRCKDCLFFTTEKSCCRPEGLIKAREDDFCSYGERREE